MTRRPPVLRAMARDPVSSASPAGYLDLVQLHDSGRYAVFTGWTPLLRGRTAEQLAVVIPGGARRMEFRSVRRPDVANMVGGDHLYAGFRIEAVLRRPLSASDMMPHLWCQWRWGGWRRLHDEATVIETPLIDLDQLSADNHAQR